MEKRVKIYCNKKLFITTVLMVFGVFFGDTFLFYLATEHFTSRISRGAYPVLGLFLFMSLGILIAALFLGADAHMIFTRDGVTFQRWFKTAEFHPYKDYPYVEKAFYMYYGMPMYYIVLSNWRLSETQRASINWGASTVDCIKIRYKKKEYEALMSIVPPRIASTIRAKFSDVPFGKLDFLLF